MKKIDLKLEQVYRFIMDYTENNGFPPSVRDICYKCGIKSTATAFSYVEKLKEKGLLTKSPLKKRTITLNNEKVLYKNIPIVGTIRAGEPLFAVENLDGYIPIPKELESGETEFALKVRGNSMINAGIYENDTIIVSAQQTAENGDIVVALIEDSATVKRFFKKQDKIILHPENDDMEDMVFDNVMILGKVKGLIRKF